ncbi:MAG: hypothetical protein UY23_C0005G0059 [Candidatus Jorgensenbacteria bacterium GW2011_GWA1_48_11]|uniref:DUF4145 domain-containing protein n=1 Tax=Candidatus Jorgensenbacteria bacterium GW2011_GWA1_48_11 TaxID=1618660 RepID=A0A0G1WKV9_9BACT|nr:MAG: hypothetical protein UY23_C0005G0059 [Candidatus Jorgensenbacteria bacterium GW2011_GWA1_48_11]KKW12306.1 MAG: hypothetical protein UY51_C0005G0548 [Candidatus Jorgensenbacteria bacterium GW2011_GWB1_49_9]
MAVFVQIYDYFLQIPWVSIYYAVREVVIFIDILLFVFFIFIFIKALHYRPVFVKNPAGIAKKTILKNPIFLKRWQAIRGKAKTNPPQSYLMAVIEADKFTDDALKQLGIRGEHMADRLERLTTDDFKTLDKLWRVHKIRNELVHTPDYEIKPHDANEILDTYEAFLKELEIL